MARNCSRRPGITDPDTGTASIPIITIGRHNHTDAISLLTPAHLTKAAVHAGPVTTEPDVGAVARLMTQAPVPETRDLDYGVNLGAPILPICPCPVSAFDDDPQGWSWPLKACGMLKG
jgi:hypothetical protein